MVLPHSSCRPPVPGIHVGHACEPARGEDAAVRVRRTVGYGLRSTWMAGTSPATTMKECRHVAHMQFLVLEVLGGERTIMREVGIAEVGIDPDGALYVRPTEQNFSH